MDPTVNRVDHRNMWADLVGGRTNLSADEILDIWKQVDSQFDEFYRFDDAIDVSKI